MRFDAAGPSYGYLEACMRALIDGDASPIFLSSGAEDYFLSAYYFDEGQFKTSAFLFACFLFFRGLKLAWKQLNMASGWSKITPSRGSAALPFDLMASHHRRPEAGLIMLTLAPHPPPSL